MDLREIPYLTIHSLFTTKDLTEAFTIRVHMKAYIGNSNSSSLYAYIFITYYLLHGTHVYLFIHLIISYLEELFHIDDHTYYPRTYIHMPKKFTLGEANP